jgi:hypothetical protein
MRSIRQGHSDADMAETIAWSWPQVHNRVFSTGRGSSGCFGRAACGWQSVAAAYATTHKYGKSPACARTLEAPIAYAESNLMIECPIIARVNCVRGGTKMGASGASGLQASCLRHLSLVCVLVVLLPVRSWGLTVGFLERRKLSHWFQLQQGHCQMTGGAATSRGDQDRGQSSLGRSFGALVPRKQPWKADFDGPVGLSPTQDWRLES